MFKSISSKLFKTWVSMVAVVSTVGFIWCSIICLHDSYVAYKILTEAKTYFSKVEPHGNTSIQLRLIGDSQWLLTAQDVEDQFTAGCFNGAKIIYRSFKYKPSPDLAASCRTTFNKLPKDEDGFVDGTTVNDNFVEYGCGFGIGAALKELKKVDQLNYFLPKAKECVKRSESELQSYYETRKQEFETKVGISLSTYGAYIPKLWGDSDFANISYMLAISLWLVIGGLIIATSYALKKWIIWLITK